MSVPMVNLWPLLETAEAGWRANLERMFCRGQFILGEQVAAFEREFAHACSARFAVGVGSGTAALELCLRAAGLGGSKKEALTPALTSPFTAQAILAAGCVPAFADVDPDTLLIDAADAAQRIHRRTAALLPVHLYGQACELAPLRALARRHGLALVQDACQAHGARSDGRPFTDFSPWVAYSFYPTKNLGCLGDGGAVLTNSQRAAAALRLLRDGGRRDDQIGRVPALNSRLDEMQACYLSAFLPHLEEWNRSRARIAALYDEALAGCDGLRTLRRRDSVNHLYVIRAERRDALRAFLLRRGIRTGVHYPVPLHLQPAFRAHGLKRGALPQAETACREIVSLPLWPLMPDAVALEVAGAVRAFYR